MHAAAFGQRYCWALRHLLDQPVQIILVAIQLARHASIRIHALIKASLESGASRLFAVHGLAHVKTTQILLSKHI
jgi:hypothetical protein